MSIPPAPELTSEDTQACRFWRARLIVGTRHCRVLFWRARLIVGTRHCRVLISANNSDATGNDITG